MPEEIRVHVVDYGPDRNLVMRYKDPLTGKHIARSTGTRKLKQAHKKAAQWEAELQEGRYVKPVRISWSDFRDRFEEEKVSGMSDSYAVVCSTTFNHFEKLGIARLSSVTTEALSRFQAKLRKDGVSESSIRTYLKHLHSALAWAHEIGLLAKMPKISLPKRARKTSKMKGRPISGEEFERMLKAVPVVCPHDVDGWKRYLKGLWLSGLRLQESLTLSWDDDSDISIDLSGKHPRFRILAEGQKRFEDQLLPMTPDFATWLLATPESQRNGHVFAPRGRNGPLRLPNSVGRVVSKIGRQANVVVDKKADKFATAHDLRRSFGTRWSRKVKPATLQLLMRHADIKTTMTYYVDQDADDIAADLWSEFRRTGAQPEIATDEAENGAVSGEEGNTLGNTPQETAQNETGPGVITPEPVNTSASRDDRT